MTAIARDAEFHDEGYGYDLFGLHPPTLDRIAALGAPLYDRYFRVESWGADKLPRRGPTILAANHSGVLPVDAAMLCLDLLRKLDPPRIPRAVADHFVPRLPIISTIFARCGMIDGTRANVDRLLERGELVAIWPEGTSGPAKRFRDRYRIQNWHVGFAELAIRHRAPVVPVSIVGVEESWPLAGKLGARIFGAPYWPLPAWPLPIPARIRIQYGTPQILDGDPHEAAKLIRAIVERQIRDLRNARRGWFR